MKPCHRCGGTERIVSTGRCRECNRRYLQQYKATKAGRDGQRGKPCAICTEAMVQPCFDEVGGTLRGWLCHHCNLALGHLRENPVLADRAAAYLRASNVAE